MPTFSSNVFNVEESKFNIQSNLCLKTMHGEQNNQVCVHRWSLIAGHFMQKVTYWETKSVVAIDQGIAIQRWSLNTDVTVFLNLLIILHTYFLRLLLCILFFSDFWILTLSLHTTTLQQTTLNVFCQNIEIPHN